MTSPIKAYQIMYAHRLVVCCPYYSANLEWFVDLSLYSPNNLKNSLCRFLQDKIISMSQKLWLAKPCGLANQKLCYIQNAANYRKIWRTRLKTLWRMVGEYGPGLFIATGSRVLFLYVWGLDSSCWKDDRSFGLSTNFHKFHKFPRPHTTQLQL